MGVHVTTAIIYGVQLDMKSMDEKTKDAVYDFYDEEENIVVLSEEMQDWAVVGKIIDETDPYSGEWEKEESHIKFIPTEVNLDCIGVLRMIEIFLNKTGAIAGDNQIGLHAVSYWH